MFAKKDTMQTVVEESVRKVVEDVLSQVKRELGGFGQIADLRKEATTLREQIETLRIEKARKEEEHSRREREVEHKVGLERKRQEFEVGQAKREAVVSVREENLAADRKRFEDQMKFHQDRFEQEVGYLKDMLMKVLARLPATSAASEDEDAE